MELRFFDLGKETHRKALVCLMLEFETNGELVDIAENIELTEEQAILRLTVPGQRLWFAFRDIGIDTSEKIYAWEEKYKHLLAEPERKLELTSGFLDELKGLLTIEDKPWVDPVGEHTLSQ